jgi:hypothetical protein
VSDGINVITNRIDNARTGANTAETSLTRGTVAKTTFGKLFARPVDGDIYAQPLVVSGVDIPGIGRRAVVYVATCKNTLYAFDADDPHATEPFWRVSRDLFGDPAPRGDVGVPGYNNFATTIGITGTPAIDLETGTIYVEAKSKRGSTLHHHLHALDIRTGNPRTEYNSPVEITAECEGRDRRGRKRSIRFDPQKQLNRAGLLLHRDGVYVAYGSHGDDDPVFEYHGWVLGYGAQDLAPRGIFCSTPFGDQGGIWQSGAGLAADDSGIYAATGNGSITASNYSMSIVRLDPSRGLAAADWFSPLDAAELNEQDLDLCGGTVLLPETNWVLTSGKDGKVYVVDRSCMGHRSGSLIQRLAAAFPVSGGGVSNIHGTPPCWWGPDGLSIYTWGEEDYLRAFTLEGWEFHYTSRSAVHVPPGMPGGMLAISAHASRPGTGILWASHPVSQNAVGQTVDGIVRAFDASDVSRELWNSSERRARDDVGKFAKFCPPTVANGKVYVATFADLRAANPLLPNALQVYGLL